MWNSIHVEGGGSLLTGSSSKAFILMLYLFTIKDRSNKALFLTAAILFFHKVLDAVFFQSIVNKKWKFPLFSHNALEQCYIWKMVEKKMKMVATRKVYFASVACLNCKACFGKGGKAWCCCCATSMTPPPNENEYE